MTVRPPDDIEARDLVSLLLQRPRPSDTIDWPGPDAPPGFERLRIVIPPESVHGDARLSAHDRMKAVTKGRNIDLSEWNSPALASVLNDLIQKDMVARVLFHEKPIPNSENLPDGPHYRRCFSSAVDVERTLTRDQIEVLFNQWLYVEHRLGPRFAVMSEDDVFYWIEKLKEGLHPLASLALPGLVELIHGFHTLLVNLLSNGSPNPDSPQKSSQSISDSAGPTS